MLPNGRVWVCELVHALFAALIGKLQRNIGEPPMRHFQAALSPAYCAHWLWRSFWSAVWMRHCSYCQSCCHALLSLLSSVFGFADTHCIRFQAAWGERGDAVGAEDVGIVAVVEHQRQFVGALFAGWQGCARRCTRAAGCRASRLGWAGYRIGWRVRCVFQAAIGGDTR